ncbi:MFS transporter [Nocardia transvalensis]|uniref:MFS transporter n=1 Tax=Nocardia transvalensis TaxID=37333 RepID=UPI001895582F|nr:MFS transporter [Nocardia transvalensis]MBF6332417.1 MFS transporter [Nocardia transvalensis]
MTTEDSFPRRREQNTAGWTLVIVCIAAFMLVLDITVVLVALPSMADSLHADLPGLQWVVDAYTLVLAALLLTAGTLGDRLGHRRLFIVGTALFTLGSLTCGLATGTGSLIAFRALQGVGAVALLGAGLPLIAAEYPVGRARNTAIALLGAAAGVGEVMGPLAGGLLTEGLGWRSIFFANVPVGMVLMVVALWRVRETRNPMAGRVDWPGTVTVSIGCFLVVYAMIRGNWDGWTSPRVLSAAGLGVAALIAFIIVERRREHPMLDLALFANPMFSANAFVAFVVQGTLLAALVYLSLFVQNTLGSGPIATGTKILPLSIMTVVAAVTAGWLLNRVVVRELVAASAAFSGVGLLAMAHLDAESSWSTLIPGLLLAAVGLGFASTVNNEVALSAVPAGRSGMAAGALNSIKQAGVAAGVAAFGALFSASATRATADQLQRSGPLDPAAVQAIAAETGSGSGLRAASYVSPDLQPLVANAIRVGTTYGLNVLLMTAAALAGVATVVGYVFADRRRTFASNTTCPLPGEPTTGRIKTLRYHALRRRSDRRSQ